jgi:hypothetical protein
MVGPFFYNVLGRGALNLFQKFLHLGWDAIAGYMGLVLLHYERSI